MKYATTVFLVLLSLCSQAQTKTWDGGAGTNNWEDADNWNPNGVPTILNDVEIDNDSVSVNANQTVKSILLESTHATETKQAIFLQNGITLSIFNSSNSGIEMNDEARFWNAGNLIISNVGSAGIYIFSGVFENMANQGFINVSLCQQGINNLGTFQNRNNAEVSISDNTDIGVYNAISGSQFSNRGSITVSDGSIGLHNSGTLLNRGDITLEKIGYIGMITLNYLKNHASGTIKLDTLYDEGLLASYDFINEGALSINSTEHNGIEDIFNPLNFTNSGTISISNTKENGIYTSISGSVLKNLFGGVINVDSSSLSGIYSKQILINEGEINANYAGRDGIEFDLGGDTLSNTGIITIHNTDRYGISHEGSYFLNEATGVINLDTLGATGLLVSSKFMNQGDLNIKNAAVHGIYNSLGTDSLINNGTILIENTGAKGLEHHGELFINNSGAEFAIESTNQTGFEVYDKFINEGNISIKNTGNHGLHNFAANTDSLINNGTIIIENSNNDGIRNEGLLFINGSGGEISIDGSGGSGFYRENKLINSGNLAINNSGGSGLFSYIYADTLINSGHISIYNTFGDGIIIGEDGPLLNKPSGFIEIDSSASDGIRTSSKIINDGEILVYETLGDGLNFTLDTLINNGLISVINAENGIEHGGDFFINSVTGEIVIVGTSRYGCSLSNDFMNNGSLIIKNTEDGLSNDGYILNNNGFLSILNSEKDGLLNDGIIINGISGEIIIDSTGETGFYNEGRFSNDGNFSISNTIDDAFSNQYESDSLINNGLIEIQKFESSGLSHEGKYLINGISGEIIIDVESTVAIGIVNEGKLINEGMINVNNPINDSLYISIESSDSLINESCASIIVDGIVKNYSSFHNKGFTSQFYLFFNSGGGERDRTRSASGSFLNDGTFINPVYYQLIGPEFINNGNVVHPFKGTFSNGIKEMNIATTGASPSHTITTTWWADKAKTMPAGTYDNIVQTFTPNAAGVAADTLWMELNSGSCTIMASIPVNQVGSCPSVTTVTFTGTVSADWHTAENWNKGVVPSPCTVAIIPTGQNCTITSGRKARAHRIETETGAVFDAELGVVLDVNPEN